MDRNERFQQERDTIEALLSDLVKADVEESWTALRRLEERVYSLNVSFRDVPRGVQHREALIAAHCRDSPPPIAIHEEYHNVSEQLLADVITAFAAIKTFLNALTVSVGESLPQTQTRGLRFKGFGALVESAIKTSDPGSPLAEIRSALATTGASYRAQFIEYRDKHLEHPRSLPGRMLRHGAMTTIVHTDGPALKRTRSESRTDISPLRPIDKIVIRPLFSEGTLHYFHLKGTVTPGQLLAPGKVIGDVEEPSSSHLSSWNRHYHVFGTPKTDGDLFGGNPDGSVILVESPDPLDAMSELFRLTTEVVQLVAAARQ